VIEHLPCIHEGLGSILSTAYNHTRERERQRERERERERERNAYHIINIIIHI
jgi:hypothetical protein